MRDIDQALVVMAGNKADMEEHRVVSTEEAQIFAEDQGILFYEISALNG